MGNGQPTKLFEVQGLALVRVQLKEKLCDLGGVQRVADLTNARPFMNLLNLSNHATNCPNPFCIFSVSFASRKLRHLPYLTRLSSTLPCCIFHWVARV